MAVRPLALVALASLAVAAPTAAAAGKRRHPLRAFSINATMRLVSFSGNPPNAGATGVETGRITGTFGRGRATFAFIWTALRTFSGSMYIGRGGGNAFRGTIHGHGTLQPDGSTSVAGGGRITDGVGTYRGINGTYTFTATVPADRFRPVVFHLRGRVRR